MRRTCLFIACSILAFTATTATAVVVPETSEGLAAKQFNHPSLYVGNVFSPMDAEKLDSGLVSRLTADLGALGVRADQGFYDYRGGTWGSLIMRRSLLPGEGVGNNLSWDDFAAAAPRNEDELRQRAWSAFRGFLSDFEAQLGINVAEVADPQITVHEKGRLIQITAGRMIDGVRVRDASVRGVINRGNLVLYGSRNFGAANPALAVATVDARRAERVLAGALAPYKIARQKRAPEFVLVPVSAGTAYSFRPAWVFRPDFGKGNANFEALVAADNGELMRFADTNDYGVRNVQGGVLPITNNGIAGDGGVEQGGWPMPFMSMTDTLGPVQSDAGGNVVCATGTLTGSLTGAYADMADVCGASSLTAPVGDMDWGTHVGTDCSTPGVGGAGNTKASRSGFYEINQIQLTAQGQLPENEWVRQPLTANMNINSNCNAFWDGSTINFYTSGGGCANTGEIAAVFDHEWGHGLDANDSQAGVSTPGESIADMYGFLRLWDPCFGRGFLAGDFTCNGGYGDPCVGCDGVRGSDWAGRQSGMPHDIDWILSPTYLSGGGCAGVAGVSQGPCGQETHCEGYIPAEAVWDLAFRDLQGYLGSSHNLDASTAVELATRMTFVGGGFVSNWYQCTTNPGFPPTGAGDGCNADGGYLNYIAADDDNGDLNDGTPHMTAIFAAYDRHQIACGAPTVQDSGCTSLPAPAVTVTPLHTSAIVEWTAVPGAEKYVVFRTDGVFQCDFGKIRVAETTDLSFVDTQLQNGREYYYTVSAVGAGGDACLGTMSACTATTPAAGAFASVDVGSLSSTIVTGDGDDFIDNCETVDVTFDVFNSGDVALTNLELVSVSSPSHPGVGFHSILPPVAGVADCATGQLGFSFDATGLSFNDTLTVDVEITALELVGSIPVSFQFHNGESDFVFTPTLDFGFDTTGDLEGWTQILGTFTQTPPGSAASGNHLASRSAVDNSCDQIRSPLLRMTATTTLSMDTQYVIETTAAGPYDRANVGILEVANGARTTIEPDGGKPYEISSGGDTSNGTCVVAGQPGWADSGVPFSSSSWSSAILGAYNGDVVQLDVAYATDPIASFAGFQFDEVSLTDVETQSPDVQTDICPVPPTGCTIVTPLFSDSFESGSAGAWDIVRNPQGDMSFSDLDLPTAPAPGPDLFGMEIAVDHSNVRTQRHHYVAKSHADTDNYCWQFLFDPNSISIPTGRFIRIWGAQANNNRRLLEMAIRNIGGTYNVAVQVVKDGGAKVAVPFAPISDDPHLLGGEWSNTPAGGVLRMFVDGVETGAVTGISNVTRLLRTPGMGNLGQFRKGTLGSMYFDEFAGGAVTP